MEKYVESYYVVNPNSDIDIACLQDDLRDIEDYTGNLVFTSKGIFPLVDKKVNKLVDEGFEVLYEDECNGLTILANDKDAVIVHEQGRVIMSSIIYREGITNSFYNAVDIFSEEDIEVLRFDLSEIENFTGNLIYSSIGIFPQVSDTIQNLKKKGYRIISSSKDLYNLVILTNNEDTIAVFPNREE